MTTSDKVAEATKHQRLIEATGRKIAFCVTFVGAVVILLLAAELMIGAAFWLNKVRQGPIDDTTGGDPRAHLPVYHNVPDERKFAMDGGKVHFEPYIHWRRDKVESQYVNVDADGLRKTVKSPVAGAPRVFMFGGSTTWGSGAADAYTIPSLLQQRLGHRYDVYNYGETGFVSAQEFNLLLRELAFGNVPDIVIFYDGFNDGYAGAYSPGIPRDPQNERIRQQNEQRPLLRRIIGHTNTYELYDRMRSAFQGEKTKHARWDQNVAPKVSENARKVLDVYEQFVLQAKAVADAYGFKVFFFWQPHLLSGTRNAQPYEQEIVERTSPALVDAMRKVHREASLRLSERESENIFFLGNALDNVDEPIYIDWAHVGPRGNDIIAEAMMKRVSGRF